MNSSTPYPQRCIIHIDMDAFYASVEQRDNPSLRGKPVIVGGSPQSRGVVCAASYEARKFGIRSAMACSKAYRLCPQGIFVRPRMQVYKEISTKLHQIFHRYTSLVEGLAFDEAYLDVTNSCSHNFDDACICAEEIRQAIRKELILTASAGISINKLLAKIASDQNKPNGLCAIRIEDAINFLQPLSARCIPGIGPKAMQRLQKYKIKTIGDIQQLSHKQTDQIFGNQSKYFYNAARGIHLSPVRNYRTRKSIGAEETYHEDLHNGDIIKKALWKLAKKVLERCERNKSFGKRLTVKVKWSDFTQNTRCISLNKNLSSREDIYKYALECWIKLLPYLQKKQALRLLGISVSNFINDDLKDPNDINFLQQNLFHT